MENNLNDRNLENKKLNQNKKENSSFTVLLFGLLGHVVGVFFVSVAKIRIIDEYYSPIIIVILFTILGCILGYFIKFSNHGKNRLAKTIISILLFLLICLFYALLLFGGTRA